MKRLPLLCAALRAGQRSSGVTALAFALLVLPCASRMEAATAAKSGALVEPEENRGAAFLLEREAPDLREGYALLSSLIDDEAFAWADLRERAFNQLPPP